VWRLRCTLIIWRTNLSLWVCGCGAVCGSAGGIEAPLKEMNREGRRVVSHTPYFIRPSSCHISDPFDTGIITLLEHLEVAHQQARASEHQQTEGERQRWSRPGLLVRHGCECCICAEHVFCLTCKSRNSVFLHVRYVVGVAELK